MKLLNPYIQKFEDYLNTSMGQLPNLSLYEPIKYIMDAPGKRIRPALAMLGCELTGGDPASALPVALAVEVFHNFTLVHDDIMDDADIRRGKESVHIKYGESNAILSGDAMMMLTYKLLDQYPGTTYNELIRTITRTGLGLCEGQQSDMDFEVTHDVSIQDYLLMIEKKTSILLGAALKMGSIVSGADIEKQEHLYQFGKNIGIAFQIHDDILDAFGDTVKVGKVRCGDIINNKKTYLYLKALELSDEAQKNKLKDHFSSSPDDPTDKINEVLSMFRMLAVEEYANQLKEAYLQLGKSHLLAVEGDEAVKSNLISLSDFLIQRES